MDKIYVPKVYDSAVENWKWFEGYSWRIQNKTLKKVEKRSGETRITEKMYFYEKIKIVWHKLNYEKSGTWRREKD